MRVAMVSEHASPLATLGGEDAGGQNVHVAALAERLGARGVPVVVHTRRDDARAPRRVPAPPAVARVVANTKLALAVHERRVQWMAEPFALKEILDRHGFVRARDNET